MRRRTLTWLGGAVVAAILAATAVATAAALEHERTQARDQRAELARPVVRGLAADVADLAASGEDTRALFEATGQVSAAAFHRFAASPFARDASLQLLVWSAPGPSGPGHVVYREARPGAAPAEALELATPQAGEAARAARDAALPRLSAPIPGDAGTRVVMAVPVYAPGAAISTPAERRGALRGLIMMVARPDVMGQEARAALPPGAHLRVSDDGATVIGTGPTGGEQQGLAEAQGRRWAVSLGSGVGTSIAFPLAVGIGGLMLAAAVGLLFLESGRRERDAIALAERRSAESSRARSELERLQVRHDLILASAGDGIMVADPEGRVTFANPAAAAMLGWSVDDLTGPDSEELVLPGLRAALNGGGAQSGERAFQRRDGTSFDGEHTTTPILENGRAIGAVITIRDVTARKRLETRTLATLAAAEERAAVDPLTGLANHRTFHERLRTEVERSRRGRHSLSLVVMDLDHFKRVNDVHGHQVGDRVLRQAAKVLTDQTRAGELVARVGGEEFAMILPDARQHEALRAADRVRRAVASADFGEAGPMTVSAGVCDLSRAGDADGLYQLADTALYWAKRRGRNMALAYSPEARPAGEDVEGPQRGQALVSLRLLARVVDAKHPSTRGHSGRVAELCGEIAAGLGWPDDRVALLREAAGVHDVGKIGVPETILFAAGPLTPEEFEAVKEHAVLGARIVAATLTDEQVAWVRGHHERWDGRGYPDGLAAEDIPEGARIMALADAWDVMTSERPDSPVPATSADAAAECRRASGSQFWPAAVEILVAGRIPR